MKNDHHVVVGGLIVLLCSWALFKQAWILEHSEKGQGLLRRFGPQGGPWVLRLLLAVGIVFGGLLAAGIVRPIQWERKAGPEVPAQVSGIGTARDSMELVSMPSGA